MKKIVSFITVFFVFAISIFAQDTTATTPDVVKLFNIALPQWAVLAIVITGATLTATQTILAKIPTEKSVKISGIIGKILDLLSFFPADNKKGGGTH
jgi:hypothetical protein